MKYKDLMMTNLSLSCKNEINFSNFLHSNTNLGRRLDEYGPPRRFNVGLAKEEHFPQVLPKLGTQLKKKISLSNA